MAPRRDYTDEWSDNDNDSNLKNESLNPFDEDSQNDVLDRGTEFDPAKFIEIKDSIAFLGGKVIPRLNWNAPTDAIWIATGNTLECENASQILLLLKSSDKICNDLQTFGGYSNPFASGELEPEIVLRQHVDIVPSMVFRCFVKDSVLIAISQVDCSYYEFLFKMDEKIEDFIYGFHSRMDPFDLENYCFDVYLNSKVDRAVILDFDPWFGTTSPLLFTWDELNSADSSTDFGLRLFPESMNMGPGNVFNTSKYSASRFPIELSANSYYEAREKFFNRLNN
ncbi:Cell division cycle protein 123 [Smittium mucronatum]|uniref:Cell division cycle protein 123 n=1 Tax=Smittium mucronatum TaxID=133383 RepID=A0A1R0H0L5_9FUNG|nr:Cell division cycle protein 123 [Smittium mucronatum]